MCGIVVCLGIPWLERKAGNVAVMPNWTGESPNVSLVRTDCIAEMYLSIQYWWDASLNLFYWNTIVLKKCIS